MRIGIATVYTPGIQGGAELHAEGLSAALKRHGHVVHHIRMPFRFDPPSATANAMERARAVDFTPFRGGAIDRLICLKFPTWLIGHPRKTVWVLHQHRPAYDLFDSEFGWSSADGEHRQLRDTVIAADGASLGAGVPIFANSRRVAERLLGHNGIASTPLYHPPADETAFHCATAEPYIFAPGRLETLKRQDLLLRAIAACPVRVQAVFSGTGPRLAELRALAQQLEITDRVRFLGAVSRPELIALYAHCAAVYFGPLDEDYGYVTLEAMLSAKPVLTCSDSGGPLEFVVHGQTGAVTEPRPEALAAALEAIASDPEGARRMGEAGRERYRAMEIAWDHVVASLLGADGVSTRDTGRAAVAA